MLTIQKSCKWFQSCSKSHITLRCVDVSGDGKLWLPSSNLQIFIHCMLSSFYMIMRAWWCAVLWIVTVVIMKLNFIVYNTLSASLLSLFYYSQYSIFLYIFNLWSLIFLIEYKLEKSTPSTLNPDVLLSLATSITFTTYCIPVCLCTHVLNSPVVFLQKNRKLNAYIVKHNCIIFGPLCILMKKVIIILIKVN